LSNRLAHLEDFDPAGNTIEFPHGDGGGGPTQRYFGVYDAWNRLRYVNQEDAGAPAGWVTVQAYFYVGGVEADP